MTVREAKIYFQKELSDFYPENEISGFTRILFSDVFGLSSVQLISKENDYFAAEDLRKLKEILIRLKNNEPLQYIIGYTEFYGLQFYVSPAVLIPRPETEELVDLIIEEQKHKKNLTVLDIGTGSGCIAVSLAKHLESSSVSVLDISENALKIAKRNALQNNIKLIFIQGNILNAVSESSSKSFDIIVSNPPYITVSEKQQMEKNVLEFEPEIALFVENDNPLLFYKAITKFALEHLSASGRLYFEINEQFGNEVKALLLSFGFVSVEIIKDISGRNRFVKGLHKPAL